MKALIYDCFLGLVLGTGIAVVGIGYFGLGVYSCNWLGVGAYMAILARRLDPDATILALILLTLAGPISIILVGSMEYNEQYEED